MRRYGYKYDSKLLPVRLASTPTPTAMRRFGLLSAPNAPRILPFRPSRAYVCAVSSHSFEWRYEGQRYDVPYDVVGKDKIDVLCLPSMNLASTRRELRPLMQKLAPSVTSVVCDWPGFGDASRLNASYDPELLLTFVTDFAKEIVKKEKMPVVASGHASGYVLKLAQEHPTLFSQIFLSAPTYRVRFVYIVTR